MALESFDKLIQRAAERKGGEDVLMSLVGNPADNNAVAKLSDDRVLSAFTKKIFQSGFVWRVVEQKWPDFEEVFFGFDIEKILMMPEEMLERKAQDTRIIRNFNKVKTIKANAQMMFEEQQNGHSFSEFLANWPSDDIIGLWQYLKKSGQRLGGNTGPYGLRAIGVDTFIISSDVEAYFRANDVISGGVQSKTSLTAIQNAFAHWQKETNFSLSQLSRIVAFSCGDNHIQAQS